MHKRRSLGAERFEKLSKRERRVLVYMLKGMHPDINLSRLPFINMETIVGVCKLATGPYQKYGANILAKIEPKASTKTHLFLNDKKIYKRFGHHPDKGVIIPGLGTVPATAGIKWSEFSDAYVPNPIDSPITVRLHRVGHAVGQLSMWSVECPSAVTPKVSEWLVDNLR